MKLKKTLLLGLSFVLVAALAVGGTLAYLTFTDDDVNVMTMGNVKIKQHEYERVVDENGDYVLTTVTKVDGSTQESYKVQPFTQAKPLYPAVGTVTDYDTTYVRWEQLGDPAVVQGGQAPLSGLKNIQDKFVLVENTGKTDAYVRTIIAYEMGSISVADIDKVVMISDSAAGEPWASEDIGVITVDGNNYYALEYIYTGFSTGNMRHNGGILPAGEWSYSSLAQIYMRPEATNEDCEALDGNNNGTFDVLVLSQAVQTAGFEDAETALDTAFGDITTANHPWLDGANFPAVVNNADALAAAVQNGEEVIFSGTITAPLSYRAIYGTPVAVVQKNGGIINGANHYLNIENPVYDGFAIETWGGTIKNLAITSTVGRGIIISSPNEDVYIDNVKIDGPGYAINTTEHNGKNLSVTNSTVNGWTSLAGLDFVTFTNCTFGENSSAYWQNFGYDKDYDRLIRPYVDTELNSCNFEQGFYIDLSALEAGCFVTINNCATNGVKITANNYANYITIELPAGRALADCVIFK